MSTIDGASPSEGSSSRRRSGRATSARGDRELLLLAARERAGVRRRKSWSDREQRVHLVERLVAPVPRAPSGEAEAQVLLDRELREDPSSLGHERDPRRAMASGARPRIERPVEEDVAGVRRRERP